MKVFRLPLLAAVTFFAAGCAATEPAPAPVPAADGQKADHFILRVEKGKPATFTLRENITTGFSWAAKYDAKLCKVEIAHRGPENTGGEPLCGAPGKAVVTVTLLTDAPADLTLEYRRPWEKDVPPAEVLYYAIVPKK